MKRAGLIIAVTATLIAAAAGFFLPELVAASKDKALRGDVGSLDAETVRLIFPDELSVEERLVFVSKGFDEISLPDDGHAASMSKEDALAAAESAFADMRSGYWLTYGGDTVTTYAELFLAVSTADNSASLILWRCLLGDGSGYETEILIDDATGRMLRCDSLASGEKYGAPRGDIEYIYELITRVTKFCSAYYGFDVYAESIQMPYEDGGDRTLISFAMVEVVGYDASTGVSTQSEPTPIAFTVVITADGFTFNSYT